jgi:hypothetical protein
VAVAISRNRPGRSVALVIASRPWLYSTLLFLGESNKPRLSLSVIVFSALLVATRLAILGYRD